MTQAEIGRAGLPSRAWIFKETLIAADEELLPHILDGLRNGSFLLCSKMSALNFEEWGKAVLF